jgi:hypothetical protein
MNIFGGLRRTILYVAFRSIERVLSAAIVLSLILFGTISFIWMVGLQPVSHDSLRVGKGSLSDTRISAQANRARR